MIIPVRCFSCNSPLASKYEYYLYLLKKKRKNPIKDVEIITSFSINQKPQKTIEEEAFKLCGLTRYCCKRHFLGHVDIIEKL